MPQPAKMLLLPAALAALVGLGFLAHRTAVLPLGRADESKVPALRKQIRDLVLDWVATGDTGRANEDGITKAVEIGQLLIYAAQAKDRPLYESLRNFARANLILDDPGHPFTQGMVRWRWKPGLPADASGTTEALRVAKGLWRGAKAFEDQGDRDLAVRILRSYCRHQYVDQGIWFICNYFNLGELKADGTRAGEHYAMNSYTVDCDPDLLAEVAGALGDSALAVIETDEGKLKRGYARTMAEVAAKSYELIRRCRSRSGLLYDLIQPEVGTLVPIQLAYYSPHDVVLLSNSATVAETCVVGEPAIGRKVCDFARRHGAGIKPYFVGRSGESWPTRRDLAPDPETGPSPAAATLAELAARDSGYEVHAPLVRLAVALGDRAARRIFVPKLIWHCEDFLNHKYEPRLNAASELLLTLQALESNPD